MSNAQPSTACCLNLNLFHISIKFSELCSVCPDAVNEFRRRSFAYKHTNHTILYTDLQTLGYEKHVFVFIFVFVRSFNAVWSLLLREILYGFLASDAGGGDKDGFLPLLRGAPAAPYHTVL